ncbi:MAG: DUF739 family protein [Clostridia bacterium]|nr:DUF739 family protein [Clostridia bacterium]
MECEEYEYDYSKLRGKIVEKFGSISAFCQEIELSEPSIHSKLKHRTEFTQSQIIKSCILLDIQLKDMFIYFFDYKVKKNLTE